MAVVVLMLGSLNDQVISIYGASDYVGYRGSVLIHWSWNKITALFQDPILKWIFLNENIRILINISLKFVATDPINNIPSLFLIVACHLVSTKPLSQPMLV